MGVEFKKLAVQRMFVKSEDEEIVTPFEGYVLCLDYIYEMVEIRIVNFLLKLVHCFFYQVTMTNFKNKSK